MWCSCCRVNHVTQRVCVPYLRAKLERTKRKKKQTPFHPRYLAQGRLFFKKRDYRATEKVDLTSPVSSPRRLDSPQEPKTPISNLDTPIPKRNKNKGVKVARRLFEKTGLEEVPPITDLEEAEEPGFLDKAFMVRPQSLIRTKSILTFKMKTFF